MPGRPARFMDRDGCLTEEVGYVNHVSRLHVLPRTAAAIKREAWTLLHKKEKQRFET